jgi:AraC-like DNA-binding protein
MSLHRSTLATVLQSTVNYLIHENIDAEDLLRRADIDPEIIYDSGARLPEYLSTRFWNIVLDETGDPYLYYKVVNFVEPGMLHAFGYAWMVSRTLREALTRLARYHRLITPNVEFRMERGQGVIQVIAREVDTDDPVDGVVPFTLRLCRISGGDQLRPLQVELQCNPPDDPSLIENFYGSEVRFNCSENVITFSAHDLETRVKGNNAEIAVAMDTVIQDYLARYDKDDIVSRVRKVVAETLVYGEPDKQTIADEIQISPRTLQRRLEEKGSSVKEIVDDTRHQMALDYLGRTNYSIKETSFDLGFSDPSNFSRAFKRWEGVTPSQFRRAEKR